MSREQLENEEKFQAIYKDNAYDFKLVGEGAVLSRKTEDGKFEQILMESVNLIDIRSEKEKEMCDFIFTERKIPPVDLLIIQKPEEKKGTYIESKIEYELDVINNKIELLKGI